MIEGLDIIGFSLAGVDEKNDLIRRGTRIRKVLECIEKIHRLKERHGTDNPRIHIAYMLMASRLSDLEKLPAFLSNAGVSETVVSSLSLVVAPEMQAESVLAKAEKEYADLRTRLDHVREASGKRGTPVYFHIVSPFMKGFNCSENFGNAIVIGSDGSVSPCVMKQIPSKGENFHHFKGKKNILKNMNFGNILKDWLNNICNQGDYKRFIRHFPRGRCPEQCQFCLKQFIDTVAKKKPTLSLEHFAAGRIIP